MIRTHLQNVILQLHRMREHGGDPEGDILIVFYNDQFGMPLRLAQFSGPEGVRFSGNRLRWRQADAVVFHFEYPLLLQLPEKKPPGQLWVAWTMESATNYPQLADASFMSQFDIEMTYQQKADIWVPYILFFGSDLIAQLRQPAKAKPCGKLIASFVSSPLNQSGRIEYLTQLSQYVDLHAHGRIGRNRTLDDDRGRSSKLEIISEYKFTIAFENSIAEDYVTEKYYDPLVSGSVPVYLGAPNVAEFAPGEHCFIDAGELKEPAELASLLLRLDADDDAYAAYHAWREQPILPSFERKLERRSATQPAIETLGKLVKERVRAS